MWIVKERHSTQYKIKYTITTNVFIVEKNDTCSYILYFINLSTDVSSIKTNANNASTFFRMSNIKYASSSSIKLQMSNIKISYEIES